MKKKETVLEEKSFALAIRIVRLSQYLSEEKREYVLSKQILRSGTSIGALVREAKYAQSKADFLNKLSIALKEANETEYWLKLLKETHYLTESMFYSILPQVKEVLRVLITSTKTVKRSL